MCQLPGISRREMQGRSCAGSDGAFRCHIAMRAQARGLAGETDQVRQLVHRVQAAFGHDEAIVRSCERALAASQRQAGFSARGQVAVRTAGRLAAHRAADRAPPRAGERTRLARHQYGSTRDLITPEFQLDGGRVTALSETMQADSEGSAGAGHDSGAVAGVDAARPTLDSAGQANFALLLTGTRARLWVKQKSTKVVVKLGSDLTSLKWMDGNHRGGRLDLHAQPLVVRAGVARNHKAKRRLSLFKAAKATLSVCLDTESGYE